jgi:ABC-type Co2+ transport system permease subunit
LNVHERRLGRDFGAAGWQVVLVAVAGVTGIQGTHLQGFALLPNLIQIVTLYLIVAIEEAVVTDFVVDYLSTVRPYLFGGQP